MTKPLPRAATPAAVAATCLAAAVFVPAVPAAAAGRAVAPAAATRPAPGSGTLLLCQAMTGSLHDGTAWKFVVRPKGSTTVASAGLVPAGVDGEPTCRAIQLPPGGYTVTEARKKNQPVVRVAVRNGDAAGRTIAPANGKALTSVGVRVSGSAVTTVVFSNRRG